jgi:hypothetical protein
MVQVPVIADHMFMFHAPKVLGSFEKSRGISPVLGLPILVEVGITGPQWHPTIVRVGESPRSWGYQFWSKSDHWASMVPNHSESREISQVLGLPILVEVGSQGLNGTQPK